MFGKPVARPKNLIIQTKPALNRQDISMPNGANAFGHHARAPNSNYAERWLQYRQYEENTYRQTLEKFTQESHRVKALVQHEDHIEKQQLRDAIQTKLNAKIQGYLDALEKRRDKLRNIMADEEQEYICETIDKSQRADESKYADMKQRSEALKAAKEAERLELVKQKRIQQYSQRCVELRPWYSRKLTAESKVCQLQQMRENEARRQSEAEISRMWDNLLRKQDEAFMEREVQEAIIKYNRCKKDMDVLTMQIRAKKHRNEMCQELERANFQEAQKIQEIQNQQERDEMQKKLNKRQQDAEDLKRQIEVQREFMDQRKKEEIALDNAFAKLSQLELQREQAKIVDSKGRLQKEMETYKHHLEHLREQRKKEDGELNAIITEFQRAAQMKQDAVMCKYQAGRKKLIEDVMRERAEQVRERRLRAEKELEFKKVENEMMRDIFETNRQLHQEAEKIRMMAVKQYRNDLSKQIDYNYSLKKREMEDAERRLQQGIEEERKLEALVKELIEGDVLLENEHPFRRVMTEYDCKCDDYASGKGEINKK